MPSTWMYAPGLREAHLLARVRSEAFADCRNVFHPGRFSARPAVAFYAGTVVLRRARRLRLTVRWRGRLRLRIDGRVVAEGLRSAPDPDRFTIALPAGEHRLEAIVGCTEEPPVLALDGLPADAVWQVTTDQLAWSPPSCRVAAGYPHAARLPERARRLRPSGHGLLDAGRIGCGPVELVVSGRGRLSVFPGETVAEARAGDAAHQEQPPFHARVDGPGRLRTAPMALRWLRLVAGPGVAVSSVVHRVQESPAPRLGSFASSDPQLDRIWKVSADTAAACRRELVVDGLKRDRLPWAGDLWVAARVEAATTGAGDAVRDTLVALAPPDPGARHVNNIIDYTPWWLVATREHLLRSGDLRLAAELRDRVLAALMALASSCDGDGFLRQRPHDWLFIDWGEVEKRGVVTALQGAWLLALRSGADLLDAGGGDGAPWRRRARALAAAINRLLWDGPHHRFAAARLGRRLLPGASRHANLFAVLAEGASGRRRHLAAAVLGDPRSAPTATPFMRFAEALALAGAGRRDAALAEVRTHWGGMLDRGATAFWEAFDPSLPGDAQWAFYGRPFGKSLCHAWAAGPAAFLSEELPGLSPLAPGWAHLRWRPQALPIGHLAVALPTPHGAVAVEQDGRHARLIVPDGIRIDPPRGAVSAGRGRWEVRLHRDGGR